MAKIGIDFGTTNSSLVVFDETKKKGVFTHFLWEGRSPKPMPSVVWYHGDTVKAVGDEAKKHINEYSDETGHCIVKSIKSLLGKGKKVHINGKDKEPYQIATEIIKKLRDDAKKDNRAENVGAKLDSAVFTVPISFNGKQKRDLRKAANEAGIEVITFVQEPLAAIVGLNYAVICENETYKQYNDEIYKDFANIQSGETRVVLVFDWGGGTLDITVVRVERIVRCVYYEIKSMMASDGDGIAQSPVGGRTLGQTVDYPPKYFQIGISELSGIAGDQFDKDLAELCCNRFRDKYAKKYGIKQIDQLLASKRDRILEAAEKCKIALSLSESAIFDVGQLTKDIEFKEKVLRKDFEECISKYLVVAFGKIDEALQNAGIDVEQVNYILMTGGSSQIPAVVSEMKAKFKHQEQKVLAPERPDMLIAEGAAVVAEMEWQPWIAKDIAIELGSGSYWVGLFTDEKKGWFGDKLESNVKKLKNDPRSLSGEGTGEGTFNCRGGEARFVIVEAGCNRDSQRAYFGKHPQYFYHVFGDVSIRKKPVYLSCKECRYFPRCKHTHVQAAFQVCMYSQDYHPVTRCLAEMRVPLSKHLPSKHVPGEKSLPFIPLEVNDLRRKTDAPKEIPEEIKVKFEMDKDLILTIRVNSDQGSDKCEIHDLCFALNIDRFEELTPTNSKKQT